MNATPHATADDAEPTRLEPGLYIVATPIGNMGDLSPRAETVLRGADLILAEDTRVSGPLLRRIGARAPLLAYHDHNERSQAAAIVPQCTEKVVALVSDAGTPLIADPGYHLVAAAAQAGAMVVAVPGPCAAAAALSIAGLPTDRFLFLGFPPAQAGARATFWNRWLELDATLVLYEAPHRLLTFEEVRRGTPAAIAATFTPAAPPRGECVLMLAPPAQGRAAPPDPAVDALLAALLPATGVKRAAALVADATGLSARALYDRAQALKPSGG